MKKEKSKTESLFYKICRELGMECVDEYRFNPDRRWRLDHAFVDVKLAVEEEGGVWTFGRHTRPAGFSKDMEKYNSLTEFGWYLLRYEPKHIDYAQIKTVYDKLRSKL